MQAEQWFGHHGEVQVLSVDIVFDACMGDLLREDTRILFKRAIREGVLTAILAGPPCESWSIARWQREDGPRALRSCETPWALPGLRHKELQQVEVGNALLGAALMLFFESLIHGTIMATEHPAEPEHHPDAPSIWRLPIVTLALKFAACQRILVHQGLYGAKSAKPTHLLLANCVPDAKHVIRPFQTRCTVPEQVSIGLLPDGQWSTAALKEYPPAFCKALVALISASMSTRPACLADLPTWFSSPVEKLCRSFDWEAKMGQDFARPLIHN